MAKMTKQERLRRQVISQQRYALTEKGRATEERYAAKRKEYEATKEGREVKRKRYIAKRHKKGNVTTWVNAIVKDLRGSDY